MKPGYNDSRLMRGSIDGGGQKEPERISRQRWNSICVTNRRQIALWKWGSAWPPGFSWWINTLNVCTVHVCTTVKGHNNQSPHITGLKWKYIWEESHSIKVRVRLHNSSGFAANPHEAVVSQYVSYQSEQLCWSGEKCHTQSNRVEPPF